MLRPKRSELSWLEAETSQSSRSVHAGGRRFFSSRRSAKRGVVDGMVGLRRFDGRGGGGGDARHDARQGELRLSLFRR